LRRTWITKRKHFYHRLDVAEYLKNTRREFEGKEAFRWSDAE
jgi:hypothetical protein